MPNFNQLTDRSVLKPSYQLMERAYNDYKIDSKPCKRGLLNQCAVRMSIALERCGFSLNSFDRTRILHSGGRRCVVSIQHAVSASDLANYLRTFWGQPKIFAGQAAGNARQMLRGHKGVIYFNNCFTRDGQTVRRGDHIDLWNGENYFNRINNTRIGGDAGADAEIFNDSDAVWFYALTG